MTPCFQITGHVASGIGNNDVGAVQKQVVNISDVFDGDLTLFDCVVVYSGGPGTKCDAFDCLAVKSERIYTVVIVIG